MGLAAATACGIFPDQRSNPCLLCWQANSLPLNYQESSKSGFSVVINRPRTDHPNSFQVHSSVVLRTHTAMPPPPPSISRWFSSSQTETPSPLNPNSPSPSPQPPGTHPSTFCHCESHDYSRNFVDAESSSIHPFVAGLFHLT